MLSSAENEIQTQALRDVNLHDDNVILPITLWNKPQVTRWALRKEYLQPLLESILGESSLSWG